MSLHADGSYDTVRQGAQEAAWPGVEGDEVYNRWTAELGVRAADAILTEGMGDPGAITWRAEEAWLEATFRAEAAR